MSNTVKNAIAATPEIPAASQRQIQIAASLVPETAKKNVEPETASISTRICSILQQQIPRFQDTLTKPATLIQRAAELLEIVIPPATP